MIFQRGELLAITIEIRHKNQLVDADNVTVKLISERQSLEIVAIRIKSGVYQAEFNTLQYPGNWWYEVAATGNTQSVSTGTFTVS